MPTRTGAQEAITVTAPRRAADPTTTVVLDQAAIARSGATSLGDLLNQLPALGGQGVNGAQDDNGFGEFFVDLRNLNFNRTLVLVDGRRFVLSGIQTDEAVDLNGIPAAFVDRIEVLKDGSHPEYGPDAVAGVVNVVLKHGMEGVEASAQGGGAGAGGAGTGEVSLLGGHRWESGGFTIGLDVLRRDPVLQADRGWAAAPIGDVGVDGQLLIGSDASLGGHAIGEGVDAQSLGGGRFRPFHSEDRFNPAPDRYLEAGLQRETVQASGDWSLAPALRASASLIYTERAAVTELPPQILGLTGTAKHPDGFVVPPGAPGDPFAVPVTLERVVGEAGPLHTTTSGPVWRVMGVLDGDLPGGWSAQVALDHGQSLSRYETSGTIDLTRALATVGAAPCPAAAGCVAADWFGAGSLLPAALAYVSGDGVLRSTYTETVMTTRVAGPILRLPGGSARLTLGVEWREEAGSTGVDAVTRLGDQAGDDAAPTAGGYGTHEAFARLDLPLLRDVPWARSLDVTLTGRDTETDRYGTFPTGRAAVDWAPASFLHLHGVLGAAARPPAIAEAFGGITTNLLPATDPCDASAGLRADPEVDANCRAQGLGPEFRQKSATLDIASGGNSSLRPERSTNAVLGAVLTPPPAPWLTLGVDWFHYRVGDAIDSLADSDPNVVADACYTSPGLSSPFCPLISRLPGGGNAGQISRILALDENVGTIVTSGLDFSLSASVPLGGWGRIAIDWQTTWLTDWRIRSVGESAFTQYAGTFPGLSAVGLYPRVKSRAAVEVTHSDWAAGWTGRYLSGGRLLEADGVPAAYSRAPAVLYHDLHASRRFGRFVAAAGIDNLTDVRPPALIDGETNTDTATYDVVGRYFWTRLSCAF